MSNSILPLSQNFNNTSPQNLHERLQKLKSYHHYQMEDTDKPTFNYGISIQNKSLAPDFQPFISKDSINTIETDTLISPKKSWTQMMLNKIEKQKQSHNLDNSARSVESCDEISVEIDVTGPKHSMGKESTISSANNYKLLPSKDSKHLIFERISSKDKNDNESSEQRLTHEKDLRIQLRERDNSQKEQKNRLINDLKNAHIIKSSTVRKNLPFTATNDKKNNINNSMSLMLKNAPTLKREWHRKRQRALQNFKWEQEMVLQNWIKTQGQTFLQDLCHDGKSFMNGLERGISTYINDVDGDFLILSTQLECKQQGSDQAFVEQLEQFWTNERDKLLQSWDDQTLSNLKGLQDESEHMRDVILVQRTQKLKAFFQRRWQKTMDNVIHDWIEEKADLENKLRQNLKINVLNNASALGQQKREFLKAWEKEVADFNRDFAGKVNALKKLINDDYTKIKTQMEKDLCQRNQKKDKSLELGRKFIQDLTDIENYEKNPNPQSLRTSQLLSEQVLDEWESKSHEIEKNEVERQEEAKKHEKINLIKLQEKLETDPSSASLAKISEYEKQATQVLMEQKSRLEREITDTIAGAYKSLIIQQRQDHLSSTHAKTLDEGQNIAQDDPFDMLYKISSSISNSFLSSRKSSQDTIGYLKDKTNSQTKMKTLPVLLNKSVSFIKGDIHPVYLEAKSNNTSQDNSGQDISIGEQLSLSDERETPVPSLPSNPKNGSSITLYEGCVF